MAKVKNSKKKKGVSVDLSGVETGGKAIPEGVYTVKVNEAELAESQTGNPMVKFVFEVTEGKNKGAKLFENCSLQPQALFKLKNLLMALGYDIPEGAFDLEVDDLLDLECQVEVAHEKYEGKTKSRIVEYIGEDSDDEEDEEDSDDEEDDEEDSGDEEDEEDDEEGDDEEDEDFESMTLKELKALAKERGIKVGKKMDKDAIIEALEDSDEDEEDEEDEEDDEGEDYSAMSLKDLKALARENGIKVKKGMGKDEIIEALEEDDEE